jgi:hypothetical protein
MMTLVPCSEHTHPLPRDTTWTMPDYKVTAKRKSRDNKEYDRMLDMLEAEYQMAPINPGDGPRVYVIAASAQHEAAMLIGRLLDTMHYGDWPDHIAGFEAEAI